MVNITILVGQNGGTYSVPGMTPSSQILPVSFSVLGPYMPGVGISSLPISGGGSNTVTSFLVPAALNSGSGFEPGNNTLADNTGNDWADSTLVLLWE